MRRSLAFIFTLSLANLTAMACDSASVDAALQSAESEALLANAPTFRHGWQDGKIKLGFSDLRKQADGCSAKMQLMLPQEDLDEVNAYLDKHPAKRILLGAQGYAVPEHRAVELEYRYRTEGDRIIADNADNKPLKDLHHSIEFMYQLLAQTRADVTPDSRNLQPWSAADRAEEARRCNAGLKTADGQIDRACECRIEQLAQIVSPRQMELVDFLLDQPYSTATGALIGYTEQSKRINYDCGLSKR